MLTLWTQCSFVSMHAVAYIKLQNSLSTLYKYELRLKNTRMWEKGTNMDYHCEEFQKQRVRTQRSFLQLMKSVQAINSRTCTSGIEQGTMLYNTVIQLISIVTFSFIRKYRATNQPMNQNEVCVWKSQQRPSPTRHMHKGQYIIF